MAQVLLSQLKQDPLLRYLPSTHVAQLPSILQVSQSELQAYIQLKNINLFNI